MRINIYRKLYRIFYKENFMSVPHTFYLFEEIFYIKLLRFLNPLVYSYGGTWEVCAQNKGLSCPTQPSMRSCPRKSRLLQGWRLVVERSRASVKRWWPCGLLRDKSYLGNILQTLVSYFTLKSLPLSPAPKHSPAFGSKWLLPTPTIHSRRPRYF